MRFDCREYLRDFIFLNFNLLFDRRPDSFTPYSLHSLAHAFWVDQLWKRENTNAIYSFTQTFNC